MGSAEEIGRYAYRPHGRDLQAKGDCCLSKITQDRDSHRDLPLVWISVHRTVEANLKALGPDFRSTCETARAYQGPLVGANVLKKAMEFLHPLHVNRTTVVLTIEHDPDFILTDALPNENVNLPATTTESARKRNVVLDYRIRGELRLNLGD